jgi:hypothetical protein
MPSAMSSTPIAGLESMIDSMDWPSVSMVLLR